MPPGPTRYSMLRMISVLHTLVVSTFLPHIYINVHVSPPPFEILDPSLRLYAYLVYTAKMETIQRCSCPAHAN